MQSDHNYRRMHGFMPHIIEVDLSHKKAHGIIKSRTEKKS
jgi:hypothetical protein